MTTRDTSVDTPDERQDETPQQDNAPHILADMLSMSIDELEQHVLLIRHRRDLAAARIETARRTSRNAKSNALNFRLEKETRLAEKDLTRLNTLLDKLEARVTKMRVTLIEMGEGEQS